MATQNLPSLYERLGGVYSIATVIDDFIDRIMIDPRLNANPRVDEAHLVFPLRASNTSSQKWFAGLLAGLKSTTAVP
jgi:truncated hemoglobin YjbI